MNLKDKAITHKKIGIWGFGVVGKSAAKYLVNKFLTPKAQPEQALKLSILDKRELTEQESAYLTSNNITFINQNDSQAFKNFLENNDLIIPSPGVDLREYKKYAHKFISEFDLFQQELHVPIIGITGTVGKTTITHMLNQIIKHQGVNIWTGGNIGTPVLDVLNQEFSHTQASPTQDTLSPFAKHALRSLGEVGNQTPIDLVLLELSSFQLELCKTFAPDLAVWTNFFPNHLDKHSDMQEYFMAKMQILTNQTPEQCALLPINLLDKLEPFIQNLHARLYFFSENKPAQELIAKLRPQDTLFYLDQDSVIKFTPKDTQEHIGSITQIAKLAEFTFRENLLIIFNSLYIFGKIVNKTHALSDAPALKLWCAYPNLAKLANPQALNFATIPPLACQVEHRLEKVATINDIEFYNDSKATTITSTIAAVQKLASKNQPIILILGGPSKGVDRSPMINEIKKHVKLVISFGKETEIIKSMCERENLPCQSFKSQEKPAPDKPALDNTLPGHLLLEQAVKASFSTALPGDQILLSPSGSSYDLFKDYQERGRIFKQIVLELAKNSKDMKIQAAFEKTTKKYHEALKKLAK